MRIAIDLQGCQSEASRLRGIGRYSITLVKSLIKYSKNVEFILVANASLHDIKTEFEYELRSKDKNVFYYEWYQISNISHNTGDKYVIELAKKIKSYAFIKLNADLILITSFFEGFTTNSVTGFDTNYVLPPIFLIFYDLIPLINPKQYLNNNPSFKRFYLEKVKELKCVNYLLAISQSSADEAIRYLKWDSNCIKNISSACDQSLFTLPQNFNVEKYIDGSYILYSGAGDPRKNLPRLIAAYASLPIPIINENKLVLVGKLYPPEIAAINEQVKKYNLSSDRIIILGYVSDQNLVNLYQNCSLFVFPSLHEGFGLPVLEAMSCGAPVIGSNCTSVPEIIQLEDAMFNPYDLDSIRSLLLKCLENHDFLKFLRTNSEIQSKKFSWEKVVNQCLQSFSQSINNRPSNNELDYLPNPSFHADQYSLELKSILSHLSILKKDKSFDSYLRKLSNIIYSINYQAMILCKKKFDIKKLSWSIEGPFDSNYSLAILNRNFALSLKDIGQKFNIYQTEGFGDYVPDLDFINTLDDFKALYFNSKSSKFSNFITSRNMYPPRVKDMGGEINLLHCYGWEETQFPFEWVQDFNRYLDGLTVMSSQVRKILIDNGVSVPIAVCGLGIDHLQNIKADSNYILETSKKYRFLHVSSCFPRKGIEILLKSFAQAFSIEDNVSLVIKTFTNPHNSLNILVNQYKENDDNFPQVDIIYDDLSSSELVALYSQCNALIAPSYGEGFGLPIAEAMYFSLPVITTGWGGQTDFCNSENSWLIDYQFELAKTHFNQSTSAWAKPSISSLSNLMIEVYNSSDEAISRKTTVARENIISYFTWEQVANKNINFVSSIISNKLDSKSIFSRVGWISSWNNKCGIASYSKRLTDEIDLHKYIFAPFENDQLYKDNSNVSRCWDYESFSLEGLFEELKKHSLSSIVIQFNFGFFNLDAFERLLISIQNTHKPLIIMFHSTKSPLNDNSKNLINIVPTLKKCNRLLVHSVNDLNRLKSIGLINNVTLFPQGVYVPSRAKKISLNFLPLKLLNNFSISTFGYCLPNKGLDIAIKSIAYLRSKGIRCKLFMYNSIYNQDYKEYFESLRSLINTLDLKSLVTLDGKYYEEDEIFNNLSKTDLILFPYQESNESSSAAVRQGLSSGKPVVTTPLAIFDDIRELVLTLPGFTPEAVGDGIISIINNKENNKLHDNYLNWATANSFSLIGKRLSYLIKAIELENQS